MGRAKNSVRTRRWRLAKTGIALLLLPLCLGIGQAILRVMHASGRADRVWVAMLAGAACWLVIYLRLPKPMWVYVVGHEVTHVVWSWLFGGKLKQFKATSRGGHVVVTRTNFIVALAPYFFPIYAIVVVIVFVLGNWIWGWREQVVWFHLLLGVAYSFHVTLTWHILQTKQSDISDQGYLFSAVVIWLGNASVLLLGIPLLTGCVNWLTALQWCWSDTVSIVRRMSGGF